MEYYYQRYYLKNNIYGLGVSYFRMTTLFNDSYPILKSKGVFLAYIYIYNNLYTLRVIEYRFHGIIKPYYKQ